MIEYSADVAAPFAANGFGRRYRRGKPWAARGVTFALAPGSITALVGPNGAGKSTLIRAGVGYERPDEGRVLIEGHDPVRERSAALAYVGYVPQSPSLYGSATVADHLAMAVEARGSVDQEYVRERLDALGLDRDRVVSSLSGGEQAQVALTLCLGIRAKLLLLDEPLASLDPLARRRFLNLLTAYVRDTGATALLSSHIVTDIEQACEFLLVLNHGQLVLATVVSEARRRFSVRPGAAAVSAAIGTFDDAEGNAVVLVEDARAERRATLEEVVLGHLAPARTGRQA